MPAERQFHRFPDLPYELRYKIYLLATPPRLVPIIESFPIDERRLERCEADDDWFELKKISYQQFRDELQDGSLQFTLKLHPDLVYFARNWRIHIPLWAQQNRLESYGFTSNTSAYQPWAPTPEVPEISIEWLTRRPELAYELARRSWFYSEAPIPTFLHVCAESREALMRRGYQLAFGTRSHGPRTWFHFERDVLQLPILDTSHISDHTAREIDVPTLLSGCRYEIGQLDPNSLRRVKRLVLSDWRSSPDITQDVMGVISLLPNLSEIFLEEWSAEDLIDWFVTGDAKANSWSAQREIEMVAALSLEARCLLRSEDVDAIAATFWFDSEGRSGPAQGGQHAIPDLNLQPTPAITRSASYRGPAEFAARHLSAIMNRIKALEPRHAAIPRFTYIHTCPESLGQRLLRGRYQFWCDFDRVRADIERGVNVSNYIGLTEEPRFRISIENIKSRCLWLLRYPFIVGTWQSALMELMEKPNELVGWFFDSAVPAPSQRPLNLELFRHRG